MSNIACIIKSHNNTLIYPNAITDEMTCNCRTKCECPLNGKCRTKSIVYKASITAPNIPTRHYFGLCETEFKVRFYNHRSSFKDQRKMNATELSKAAWDYKSTRTEKWNRSYLGPLYPKQLHSRVAPSDATSA